MEIAPGVHSVGQNKAGQIHAYLLDDGNGLTAIDTLFDTDAHVMLDLIKGLGKSITDLKRIILTHAHRSHIGGVAELKRLSGATVYAHEWEADIVAGDREAASRSGRGDHCRSTTSSSAWPSASTAIGRAWWTKVKLDFNSTNTSPCRDMTYVVFPDRRKSLATKNLRLVHGLGVTPWESLALTQVQILNSLNS